MLVNSAEEHARDDHDDRRVACSSVLVGQLAFCSSPTSSLVKKMRMLRNGIFHAELERLLAGAEGIEPPTNGFGDRYSTN